MPKGSSILRKSSMARKSSMPKIISQDAFVMSVYQDSLYVSEGRAKEGEPGVEKSKPLFNLINAYFSTKKMFKGLKKGDGFFLRRQENHFINHVSTGAGVCGT